MSETVDLTNRQLRIQITATRARIKGLELHNVDASAAKERLTNLELMLTKVEGEQR